MFLYVLRRLLIFIPTFIVISLVTFAISQSAPGDPAAKMVQGLRPGASGNINFGSGQKAYIEKRQELGLDLPIFYFSISTAAYPDTLHRIARKEHRSALSRLINDYGNWPRIQDYYISLLELQALVYRIKPDSSNPQALVVIKDAIARLLSETDDQPIDYWLDAIERESSKASSLSSIAPRLERVRTTYTEVVSKQNHWKKLVPSFKFYGTNNQYHRWFFGGSGSRGFVRGDFGTSYRTHRPVGEEVWEAVGITLKLSLLAILITYLIAIPLGVWTAIRKGSVFDNAVTAVLFSFYSLPSFWIGVLLIIYFGGGDFLDWFPPAGLGDLNDLPSDASWWMRFSFRASHLVLPLIVLTYPTFAFLSRQARGGILTALSQDYIRTAQAKGLAPNKVVWKHGFRNSLLPVLTLFANVFPYAIAGSVVVEVVFSIPGMGRLTLDAIFARNFPIVYTVVMLSALMTMLGYLVVDVLYAVADPRITFKTTKR